MMPLTAQKAAINSLQREAVLLGCGHAATGLFSILARHPSVIELC
jgi:transketolase N-terminal domain/subunit